MRRRGVVELCVLSSLLSGLLLAGATPCVASRTLKDETGRTVVLPDHPHRIISLVPSITDDVFEIGGAADVVAVSDFTQYPEEARKKPSVGSILNPSMEAIVALHPDLVLGMPHANQAAVLEQMERFGIPVFLVDPHGMDGILRSIGDVGRAIGREPEAAELVGRLGRRVDAVKARVKGLPAVSVLMPVYYDPVITIGRGAFITELIAMAGGRSITDDLPAEWPHISLEAVVERAPEALLLVRGGKTTVEVLRSRPGWSGIPAVKNGRVFYVDKRVEFPSPVAIDALEDLAREFHP